MLGTVLFMWGDWMIKGNSRRKYFRWEFKFQKFSPFSSWKEEWWGPHISIALGQCRRDYVILIHRLGSESVNGPAMAFETPKTTPIDTLSPIRLNLLTLSKSSSKWKPSSHPLKRMLTFLMQTITFCIPGTIFSFKWIFLKGHPLKHKRCQGAGRRNKALTIFLL